MNKPFFHAESEQDRHTGQPRVDNPVPDKQNRDPVTGSGYPAGGQSTEPGKDAYGRGPVQRRQAGLPEEVGETDDASQPRESRESP